MASMFGQRYTKDSVIRALELHATEGNIKDWQHASGGKLAITLNDGFSGILTCREASILVHGLASASKKRRESA